MNANELAKLLEVDSWYKLVTREEIATMLRQQQAEIEALKQSKSDGNNKVNSKPVAWAVWEGSVHDMFFTKEDADELCRLKGGDAKSVPLYAHQYERPHNTVLVPCDKLAEMKAEIETLKKDNKELNAIAQRMAMAESDARKSLQWMKDVEAMGSCAHTELTDEEIDDVWFSYKGDIKDFARAILRKAQEK